MTTPAWNPKSRPRTAGLFCALAVAIGCPSAAAQDARAHLARHIPPGLWEFSFERSGVFQPLAWKYREAGRSETCIGPDPRAHLLAWIASKGCTLSGEQVLPDGHLLSGACRQWWVPGRPVPVDIRMTWIDGTRFDMHIQSRQHALLSYTEHTLARHLGPCQAPDLSNGAQ